VIAGYEEQRAGCRNHVPTIECAAEGRVKTALQNVGSVVSTDEPAGTRSPAPAADTAFVSVAAGNGFTGRSARRCLTGRRSSDEKEVPVK
jgi:hypothetical protein